MHLLGTNSVHVKAKNERFSAAASSRSRRVLQTTSNNCTKKRAARPARLFFPIQPIKSLICDVFVAVAVSLVVSEL